MSEREAREELFRILTEGAEAHAKRVGGNPCNGDNFAIHEMCDRVERWHLRHTPTPETPTQERRVEVVSALERVVKKCCHPGMKDPFDDGWAWFYMCHDALDLLNGPEEKKPEWWCNHLTWRTDGGGYWFYQDDIDNEYGIRHNMRPVSYWTACPVCGAPRPTEEGGGYLRRECYCRPRRPAAAGDRGVESEEAIP